MKRSLLHILLVPLVGSLVTMTFQFIMTFKLIMGGLWFAPSLQMLGLIVWLAYVQWLIPALAIAAADRFVRWRGWPRLGAISAAGCAALLVTIGLLYGWRWQNLLLALIGAITALLCCRLIDEVERGRLRDLRSIARRWVKVARRWPG